MPRVCPKCHYESPMDTDFCPACGAPMDEHVLDGQEKRLIREAAPLTDVSAAELLPMKWYKFLIYISLPLSVILAVVSAVSGYHQIQGLDTLAGLGLKPEYAALLPTVLYVDLAVGILLAPMLVYTELLLVRKRWRGVLLLLFLYGFQAVYGAAAAVLLRMMGMLTMENVLTVVEVAVMFFLNRVYFRKRRLLFS